MLDFIRIACAVPAVKPGAVNKNVADICSWMGKADAAGADLVVFPELGVTGYSCGDLFWQDALIQSAWDGLQTIREDSARYPCMTVVVGLPVRAGMSLYNCAAAVRDGKILGIVPKSFLSAGEERWFSAGDGRMEGEIPFDTELLFDLGDGALMGIELCEDLNAPIAPSARLCLNSANVIVNPAASNELAGKHAFRRDQVKHQSSACQCIYAYCSAGHTESTSDLVYSGHAIIAQKGKILAENPENETTDSMILMDCDLGRCSADRRRSGTFRQSAQMYAYPHTVVKAGDSLRSDGSLYPVRKLPFIPDTREERLHRCAEIFQLQVTGLKQRLTAIGGANAVIGISGGLDSTLALLVCVEAMRQLGRPSTDVYGVTMPCFGTSDRTHNNAWELMRTLGVSSKEIVIKDAVSGHFRDIGHDETVHNATFENSQARERTQILMDYASVVGGIVVGTGDISELALGWCTYNGDHMSMYSVNGTVPKTLMRWMIDAISELPAFAASRAVLQDVLDTPISPELLPPDAQGKISQQTEDLVGPYALHDFYLYYIIRYGFRPEKVYALACRAFQDDFDRATIKKWLVSFYRRFFTQQFKRNCMPDGVKVGSVSLGPRGDWSMPSDASAALWLEEANAL